MVVVAIILFGKELPGVARKAGKWYFNLRKQLTDIKDELKSQIPDVDDLDVTKDLKEIREGIKKDLEQPLAESIEEPPPAVQQPPIPSPSANLPGPEAGDPEYKPDVHARFDPVKPPEPAPPAPTNGNGHTEPATPPTEPVKPPEPPAPS